MNENQRKEQWCPHHRIVFAYDPPGPPATTTVASGNTASYASGLERSGNCIGSECSQWRWDRPLEAAVVRATLVRPVTYIREDDGSLGFVEPVPRPPEADASFTWNTRRGRWEKIIVPAPGERHGHCGLSGPATHD